MAGLGDGLRRALYVAVGSAVACPVVCYVVAVSSNPSVTLFPKLSLFLAMGWGWSSLRRLTGFRKKPVLAVDLDEVCAGYLPAFIEFHNARYGTALTLQHFHSYLFWEVQECRMADREESIHRVYEFHQSDYFARIMPLPGAREALEQLAERFELHIVTSRQTDIEPATRRFVEEHFPGLFTDLHFGNHFGKSGAKVAKPDMCRRIGAVALIDDSLHYAHQCAAAGLPAFIFGTYGWNATTKELPAMVKRVAGWTQVVEALL